MEKLDDLPNSFEKTNHVRCFNHTLQLSAKALLKPFTATTESSDDRDSDSNETPLPEDDEELEQDDDTEEVSEDEDNGDDDTDDDDDDEEEDPFSKLDPAAKAQLMEDTQAVSITLNKVRINGIYLLLLLRVSFADSQAVVCYCSLYHYCPACMA